MGKIYKLSFTAALPALLLFTLAACDKECKSFRRCDENNLMMIEECEGEYVEETLLKNCTEFDPNRVLVCESREGKTDCFEQEAPPRPECCTGPKVGPDPVLIINSLQIDPEKIKNDLASRAPYENPGLTNQLMSGELIYLLRFSGLDKLPGPEEDNLPLEEADGDGGEDVQEPVIIDIEFYEGIDDDGRAWDNFSGETFSLKGDGSPVTTFEGITVKTDKYGKVTASFEADSFAMSVGEFPDITLTGVKITGALEENPNGKGLVVKDAFINGKLPCYLKYLFEGPGENEKIEACPPTAFKEDEDQYFTARFEFTAVPALIKATEPAIDGDEDAPEETDGDAVDIEEEAEGAAEGEAESEGEAEGGGGEGESD